MPKATEKEREELSSFQLTKDQVLDAIHEYLYSTFADDSVQVKDMTLHRNGRVTAYLKFDNHKPAEAKTYENH